MNIFFIVLCFLLFHLLKAVDLSKSDGLSDAIIISKIKQGLNHINTEECKSDLNMTVNAFLERKPWAVAMFDSSVKSPVGVEYGVEYQFGNFDQCMEVTDNLKNAQVNFQSKYCLVDVKLKGYKIRHSAERRHLNASSTNVNWGVCLPASCSNEDVLQFMILLTGQKEVSINPRKCQVMETAKYSATEIVFGFAILSFVFIVAFSTCFHVYVISTSKTGKLRSDVFVEEIVKSFSIISNVKKLGKESKDELGLGCVNGIKAIAMLFIISGHALVFMVGGPVQNSVFYEKQSVMIQNAFLQNSPLLVDSFLLLSGFLFTRLVLVELDKRRGKINFGILYVFRYIRLTPAYLAMIGLYSTFFIRIGDGPLWKYRISLEQERCQQSWWKNLLYINNYLGNDSLCMFQSWYLAADTQLFVLAPLFIYPLYKCRKAGLYLLSFAALVSVVVPFYITFSQKLDPTFIVWPSEIADLSTNDYFINTYGKTHMRSSAYIFGILAGFLAFYIHKRQIEIPKRSRFWLWLTMSAAGAVSMFSVTLYYIPTYHYTNLESALYASLHRLFWSLFAGWVVIACVTSETGALRNFLSSRALVPLSRLTYCSYLTNGFIELYLAASIRTSKYMSVTNLLGETLSHVCLTFLAAIVLCLMFESPIHGIEKMLLRRHMPPRDSGSESDEFNVNSRTPSTSEASA